MSKIDMMDPTILINQELKSARKLPGRPILFILSLLVILASGFIFYKFSVRPPAIPKTHGSYPLHKSIHDLFSNSTQYQFLVTDVDQAILEKDHTKKNQLYLKVFSHLNKAYQENKNPAIVAAMYQLRNYARSVPKYQEEDFLIRSKP